MNMRNRLFAAISTILRQSRMEPSTVGTNSDVERCLLWILALVRVIDQKGGAGGANSGGVGKVDELSLVSSLAGYVRQDLLEALAVTSRNDRLSRQVIVLAGLLSSRLNKLK